MARAELALYDSVLSSNLPATEKTQLRRWFERMTGESLTTIRPSAAQLHGGLSAFRQGTESLATGIALGALNASDIGMDPKGIPVDGLLGFAGLIGSAIGAKSDMAPDARNIGGVSVGIFGFRMSTKFLVEKRLASGRPLPKHLTYTASMHGESGGVASDDPIVKAADAL
jgi:hypothetical protein